MVGRTEPYDLPEAISGDDLSLRIWRADDEEALRAAVRASDEAFRDWLPGVFQDTRDIPAFLAAVRELVATRSAFLYAIEAGNEVVGQISLHAVGDDHGLLGYWVRTDRTGRGTATAALRLLSTTALASGFTRLELQCDEGNSRSASVARRAGYSHATTRPVEGQRTRAQTGREVVWELFADRAQPPSCTSRSGTLAGCDCTTDSRTPKSQRSTLFLTRAEAKELQGALGDMLGQAEPDLNWHAHVSAADYQTEVTIAREQARA